MLIENILLADAIFVVRILKYAASFDFIDQDASDHMSVLRVTIFGTDCDRECELEIGDPLFASRLLLLALRCLLILNSAKFDLFSVLRALKL